MGEFIAFRLIERKPRTNIWKVIMKDGKEQLGIVKWYSYWRRYRFYPDTGTGYDAICMDDISAFLKRQMRIHRARNFAEKEARKKERLDQRAKK